MKQTVIDDPVASMAYQGAQKLVSAAMITALGDPAKTIHIAANGVAGVLAAMAAPLRGPDIDGADNDLRASDTFILAALLVLRMSRPHQNGCELHFDALKIIEAMDDFERFAGRSCRNSMANGLVEILDENTEELDKIRANRIKKANEKIADSIGNSTRH